MTHEKTNADYYIDFHRGYFKKDPKKPRTCSGWNLEGPGEHCERVIHPGERYLVTGLNDLDGSSIVLCEKCAMANCLDVACRNSAGGLADLEEIPPDEGDA